MVPPLILVFGFGATAALRAARAVGGGWAWAGAFLVLLVAFNEVSFALRPPAEWIRIDLLLSVPVYALVNGLLAAAAFRTGNRPLCAVLGASVLAVLPAFVIGR